jgi:hypothetical protein
VTDWRPIKPGVCSLCGRDRGSYEVHESEAQTVRIYEMTMRAEADAAALSALRAEGWAPKLSVYAFVILEKA